ncbi:MAG: hypothetical protein R6U20_06240, partial [Longimonas sp.]|uniref:hypothetical protein n=1 Tax=Longimonas sp. TaxID=2039626 RepID=UPI0039760668
MTKKETLKLYAGRIGLFAAGGLLVFAAMSLTVVNNAKKENAELTKILDTSRYESGRLLADAQAQLESNDFAEARKSLAKLFNNQPGSEEVLEGKTLMETIESAEKSAQAKWEAVMPSIKQEWADKFAEELRAEMDKERALLEENLDKTLA